MRVLLTGGTGFVGWSMRLTQPKSIYAEYLTKQAYSDGEWRRNRYDAIVHLAPVSPVYVLQSCDKVLYCSSGAVYEGQTEYAMLKRHYESLCENAIITRLFTFVGLHLKNKYAITNFIEDAKRGGPIVVKGDGSAIRSYLYGEDLGRWMWKILLEGHGIYDVGSAIHCTILEAARTVAEVIPCKIKVMNEPGVPETKYVPDITRARELGCVETVGLKEAIERMVKDDNYSRTKQT
jgi:nucleoside-diphosphate-sugar epimerase